MHVGRGVRLVIILPFTRCGGSTRQEPQRQGAESAHEAVLGRHSNRCIGSGYRETGSGSAAAHPLARVVVAMAICAGGMHGRAGERLRGVGARGHRPAGKRGLCCLQRESVQADTGTDGGGRVHDERHLQRHADQGLGHDYVHCFRRSAVHFSGWPNDKTHPPPRKSDPACKEFIGSPQSLTEHNCAPYELSLRNNVAPSLS